MVDANSRPKTIVCIGTGPSLTLRQIDIARQKGFTLYGCNRVYQDVPDLSVLYAVNSQFWDHYWLQDYPTYNPEPEYSTLRDHPCAKWTTNSEAAHKYGIRWIAERNAPGLSTDPNVIHHGHGSGFSLVSLAHNHGADRIILLGYDLKYAPDYDGRTKKIGSLPRHYWPEDGGEYPFDNHFPSVQVKDGVHVELVELYRSVAEQGLVEIINCSPDTALDCFPRMPIEDVDGKEHFATREDRL